MKRILVLLLLSGKLFQAHAGEKEIVKASLNEVTVYSQGAQLHHKANYSVKVGVTEIIVEGISQYIDAKSIQVKGTGNVVILDSRYSLYYPKPAAVSIDGIPLKIKKDIKLLEDSLKVMNFDIQEIQDEIDVVNSSKSILMNNGSMKSQGRVNDSLNFLKQVIDFYGLKMNEFNKKALGLNKRKIEKLDKKRDMEQRLTDLRNYQEGGDFVIPDNNPIPRIIITVSSSEVASGKMSLSYFVSNAGWTPFYDLRSEALTGKINLTYKAQVYQNTGLDWNDVKLSISTNNPYANKTKPELQPWYIDYYNYQVQVTEKKRNLDYNQNAPSVAKSEAYNMGYTFNNNVFEDKDAMTADEFTTVVQHLIAAEFKIDLPYTIKSNNEQHMVLIKQTDLETKFKYYSVPKLDPGVYLVAQMTKLDELQLVPARANIFFDGSYIGETYIDPTSMDDTLNLSLGKDPNIVVKRTLLKKESKDKIIGDKRERSFSYNIEVKNLKSIPVDIVIQDQIPITQNADIIIEKSDLGKNGRLDEQTGLMEWSINLKPKEPKVFDYNFKVKHNKDKQVNL
jgi:uncharacterized protein (TIGR02231 family)